MHSHPESTHDSRHVASSGSLRRLVRVLVAATLLSIPLLLVACSTSSDAPSSQVLATRAALTPAAEPASRQAGLVIDAAPPVPSPAQPSPTPEPPPPLAPLLPQAVPTDEPPVPPSDAPPPAATPPPPIAASAHEPDPTPAVVATENAAFVSRVIELINAARRDEGLGPLTPAPALMSAAQLRATAMAQEGILSHTSPDGSTPAARMQAAGYTGWTRMGEVIAAGPATPEQVVQCWLESPSHRADLLDPAFTEVGVGYYYLSSNAYGHWWVGDLGTR